MHLLRHQRHRQHMHTGPIIPSFISQQTECYCGHPTWSHSVVNKTRKCVSQCMRISCLTRTSQSWLWLVNDTPVLRCLQMPRALTIGKIISIPNLREFVKIKVYSFVCSFRLVHRCCTEVHSCNCNGRLCTPSPNYVMMFFFL